MNKITKGCLVSLLAIAFTSCADESPWETGSTDGKGGLEINITSSAEVSSSIPNVRSVDVDIVTPPSEDFNIRLTKNDGSYTKTWATIHEFEKEASFPAGTYSIEVFYGEPDAGGIVKEGDEGYEYAYYYGKQDNIVVKSAETTLIQLHASLSNSIVSIEYSESFRKYFTDWSTTLNTKGKKAYNLGKDEGYAYVAPGDVDVIISAKQQNGKTITLNPAVFEAESRHLYKIRYNIYNDEIGHVDQLQLIFNDDPEAKETIYIELNDNLMDTEAPVITVKPEEKEVKTAEGAALSAEVSFNIMAEAGVGSAELTAKKLSGAVETRSLSWLDKAIELCGTSTEKTEMTEDGVKPVGFNESTIKLAYVDLTSLCSTLPEGEYEFTLKVTDILKRTAEDSVKVLVGEGGEITVLPLTAIFGEGKAEIKISGYAGVDPTLPGKNPFTFKIDVDGTIQDAKILSINNIAYSTRADEQPEYTYQIELPFTSGDEVPVQTFMNGTEKTGDSIGTEIKYEFPEYELEYDAFAKRVKFRFPLGDDANTKLNKKNMDWYKRRLKIVISDNNSDLNNKIDYNQTTGIYNIEDLESNKNYEIKTTLKANPLISDYNIYEIETEKELLLPEISTTNLKIENINVGGVFEVVWPGFFGALSKAKDYQIISSIDRIVPYNQDNQKIGWSTINDKTAYKDAKSFNTWSIEPSTYIEDDFIILRTVGYNHNDLLNIEKNSSETSFSGSGGTRYCTNAPNESFFKKSAGELFLGDYSFNNGVEDRTDGIEFSSRPQRLEFKYSFSSLNEEKGIVIVKVKNSNGAIINSFQTELDSTDDNWSFNGSSTFIFKEIGINFAEYSHFGEKAALIEICFKSSSNYSPSIYIPRNDELSEGDITLFDFTTSNAIELPINANIYHAYSKGSELRIDKNSIKLSY